MPRSTSLERARRSLSEGGGEPPRDPGDGDGGGGGGGGDDLVKVAFAPNQPQAEMIQGLLAEHGIQSVLKRGPGFDVPELFAGGPRQIFVLASQADAAREVLEGTPGAS